MSVVQENTTVRVVLTLLDMEREYKKAVRRGWIEDNCQVSLFKYRQAMFLTLLKQ